MNFIGSAWVYACLLAGLVGLISLVRPIRRIGIGSRGRALLWVVAALVGFFGAAFVPVAERRVASPRSRLDELIPAYQFSEFHEIEIAAPAERVWQAVESVTPEEIRGYGTLTWIRRFGSSGGPKVLNPPQRQPILRTALQGGFMVLAEDRPREFVFGFGGDGYRHWRTAVEFTSARQPRMVKVGANFRVEELGAARCRLTTETRIYTVGGDATRGFSLYWKLVWPGSSIIRRSWLEAIRKRAEG